MGGVQMLSLGILGEYIGKIYLETKHRPRFHIESVLSRGALAPSLTTRKRMISPSHTGCFLQT